VVEVDGVDFLVSARDWVEVFAVFDFDILYNEVRE